MAGFLRRRHVLAFVVLAAVVLAGFPAWQHYYPVSAAEGWSYGVYLDDVPQVSALAMDTAGVLYISLERSQERGSILRREVNGTLSEALSGLSKPDGLVAFRDGVAIGQEGGDLPVVWLHGGQREGLFQGRNVEGLASDGQYLYAIEDRAGDGRLLRFDPVNRVLTVLRDGLDEGEGVAVCPNGQLFYVEKKKRWVKRWQVDGADPVVLENLNAPGFLLCNDEGLWISEDATHRARLLLLDRAGTVHTILRGLRSAQTVLPLAPGRLLLAEQGRGRVLEVQRLSDAQR